MIAIVTAAQATAADSMASGTAEPNPFSEAIGLSVTVQTQSGRTFEEATLVRVDLDKKTGQPKRLRLELPDGRKPMVGLGGVALVTAGGRTIYAADDSSSDADADADDRPTNSAQPDRQRKKPRRLTRAERAAAAAEAEERKWLAQMEARGVKPWPDLTDKEHEEEIAEHKKRIEEAKGLFPDLQMVETEHFLVATNLTPAEVGAYVLALDRMYTWMQQAYGVDPEKSVWRGKASIFALRTFEQFVAFEQRFFRNNPQQGTAGLCHSNGRRSILISAHAESSYDYFGSVLVHETSHGFIHCYKTPVRVPSWVNEGMAEVIASMMVPQSKGIQRKEKSFVDAMRRSPRPALGEAFFATDRNIPFDRYGGATSMTRFLLETEQSNYIKFIKLLKTGMPWEEALGQSYGANKQQLVSAYGRRIGVPHLLP